MPIKGDAAIKYNSGSGDVTVALNFPLFRAAPGKWKRRWTTENLSGTAWETITVGSALNEAVGTLRFIDNPTAVLTWLDWAMDGGVWRYVPSLASPANEIGSLLLVEPAGELVDLGVDEDVLSRGEFTLQLRARRTDGGTFALLPGMNL